MACLFFSLMDATNSTRKNDPMSLLLTALGTILTCYLLAGIAAHFLSNSLIFPAPPPSYTSTDYPLLLQTEDGLNIAAYHAESPVHHFTILYSHGNGGDLGNIRPALNDFYSRGFNVLAYDYPGYGLSDGKVGVSRTYASAVAAYRYLTEEKGVPPESIILYGSSLGSGPSLYLASRYPVGGVILEGAFVSTFRVKTIIPLFPHDKFQNLPKIKKANVPVLVIHGMEDQTVPFWHGKALYEAATGPKQKLFLEEAGHGDILEVAGEAYWKAILAFSESLKPETHTPKVL
jgi:hypothetical protein